MKRSHVLLIVAIVVLIAMYWSYINVSTQQLYDNVITNRDATAFASVHSKTLTSP